VLIRPRRPPAVGLDVLAGRSLIPVPLHGPVGGQPDLAAGAVAALVRVLQQRRLPAERLLRNT
jgi:hypothetical protein